MKLAQPVRTRRATPAPDLVNRNFTAIAPNRLWVAGTTRIRCGEGVFWLAAVRDAFSNRIVGWNSRPFAIRSVPAPLVVRSAPGQLVARQISTRQSSGWRAIACPSRPASSHPPRYAKIAGGQDQPHHGLTVR